MNIYIYSNFRIYLTFAYEEEIINSYLYVITKIINYIIITFQPNIQIDFLIFFFIFFSVFFFIFFLVPFFSFIYILFCLLIHLNIWNRNILLSFRAFFLFPFGLCLHFNKSPWKWAKSQRSGKKNRRKKKMKMKSQMYYMGAKQASIIHCFWSSTAS